MGDKHADLGASEDHAVSARVRATADDVDEDVPRLLPYHAFAQLVEDRAVEQRTVGLVGNDRLDMDCGERITEEAFLHREARAQQQRPPVPAGAERRCERIDDVK